MNIGARIVLTVCLVACAAWFLRWLWRAPEPEGRWVVVPIVPPVHISEGDRIGIAIYQADESGPFVLGYSGFPPGTVQSVRVKMKSGPTGNFGVFIIGPDHPDGTLIGKGEIK